MNKKLIGIAGVTSLVAATIATGCGNDPSPPTSNAGLGGQGAGSGGSTPKGGATGAGGSSAGTSSQGGSGGALTCTNVTPCGGSVVGTWNVTSSCLKVSGEMDVTQGMFGCATAPATGSLETHGTLVVNADGTYSDQTTTTGSITVPLSPSCLTVSSVAIVCQKAEVAFRALGWNNSTCTDTNGQCSCALSVDQQGAPGLVAPYTEPTARYTTAGNELTLDILKYSYCAAENALTLTPQRSALTGTIVFQREGAAGAGGSSGASSSGGAPGAGGMAGAPAGGTAGAPAGGASGAGGAGTGGSAGASAGSGGNAGSPPTGTGPCDIYEASGVTCVAAHSTIRALVGAYTGALYQVKRADGMTKDIPVTSTGFADSAQQESFCSGTSCTIMKIYDQSGHGNFLEAETPTSTVGGANGETAADAAKEALTVGGHKVYSLYTRPSQAYWRDGSKSGMPVMAEPQGIYMVTSGTHFSEGCCYDYGNGETSRRYEAGPTMDAIYFGDSTQWGYGNGSGPWIMADMEDGMVTQGNGMKMNNNLLSQTSTYVTAMEKNNGTTEFALKAADATKTPLNTYYQGTLPPGKNPMKKQGAIVLGSGGDCCLTNNNLSEGTFYEGAIVAGYPSNATDDAIHQNIVNAGYGK